MQFFQKDMSQIFETLGHTSSRGFCPTKYWSGLESVLLSTASQSYSVWKNFLRKGSFKTICPVRIFHKNFLRQGAIVALASAMLLAFIGATYLFGFLAHAWRRSFAALFLLKQRRQNGLFCFIYGRGSHFVHFPKRSYFFIIWSHLKYLDFP